MSSRRMIPVISLTVAEIKRLFNLITRQQRPLDHHLHWTIWRQRHQARARWFHHRTQLRRKTGQTGTP
jgi:uncharacterized protein (DUF2384 family)